MIIRKTITNLTSTALATSNKWLQLDGHWPWTEGLTRRKLFWVTQEHPGSLCVGSPAAGRCEACVTCAMLMTHWNAAHERRRVLHSIFFVFLFHDIAMLACLSSALEAIRLCFSVLSLELVLSVSNGFGKQNELCFFQPLFELFTPPCCPPLSPARFVSSFSFVPLPVPFICNVSPKPPGVCFRPPVRPSVCPPRSHASLSGRPVRLQELCQ